MNKNLCTVLHFLTPVAYPAPLLLSRSTGILTRSFLHQACCLVLPLLLSYGASAQSAPSWQSARAVGSGSTTMRDITVDPSGNTYEVGTFSGITTLDGTTLISEGNTDGFLAKYTPSGTLVWVRQLGSTSWDFARKVTLDAAGNVYVLGDFATSIRLSATVVLDGGGTTSPKAFVVRFSPQGTPEWAQQSAPVPSNTFTFVTDLGTDALGHVYLTGLFSQSITLGSTTFTGPTNSNNVFLGRLSVATGAVESLTLAFSYTYPTGYFSALYSYPELAVAATGQVHILSAFTQPATFGTTTLSSRGNNDVVIAKYDAQGSVEWVQQVGGLGEEQIRKGVVDAAGNLYVVGSFTGPAAFGSTTLSGAGSSDGYLIKYSAQGTMQWVHAGASSGADGWSSISLDAAGNPCVVGDFTGAAQFGSVMLTSVGNSDIAVASYTPQGQLRWAQRAGGPDTDTGSYLTLDARGEVVVHGYFTGSCSFGSIGIVGSTTGLEPFVARLGNQSLAKQASRAVTVGLYPNPATTTVHLPSVPIGNQVQLLDAVGRTACTTVVVSGGSVSLQGVPPGLYMVRATDAQGRQVSGRLVVE